MSDGWLRYRLHARHCEQCDVTRALLDAVQAQVERVRAVETAMWTDPDVDGCIHNFADDLRAALDGPQ